MAESVVPATPEEQKAVAAKEEADAKQAQEQEQPKQLDDLHTEHGDTTIAEAVVAKISGIAARQVPGVYAMGNAARRAISGLTSRVTGNAGNAGVTNGVGVQKGDYETTVEIDVVVEYGASIVSVSDQIRSSVIEAVEHGTGLAVKSVDINVSDVHLPDEDNDDDATVQQAPASNLR